jgi:hypothetical protein
MENISNILKVWLDNLKKNWLPSIINLLIYIIPIIIVKKSISELFEHYFLIFIFILIILFLFSEYIKIKDLIEIKRLKGDKEILKNKNKELEKNFENLSMYFENLPSEFLNGVSKHLELKNSDRISLYIFNGNKFEIIGRYSENPVYNQKNRAEYPSDKGYIAKCLKNNNGKPYYYVANLPKPTNKKYTKKIANDTGMTKEEINKLSMKSRTYFTRVIKSEKINRNIGILVVESINEKFNVSEIELNRKLEELSIPYMINLLEISSSLKGEVLNGK